MLFMELMFWKTPAVADQIKAGYYHKADSSGLFTWKQVGGGLGVPRRPSQLAGMLRA